MTSKLIPADPAKVMVIRDVAPGIVTLSVPFSRFGHIKVGGRAVIVRLRTGGLAVFSPVALTSDVQAKLQSLGNDVKYLIANDIEHHIFLTPWKKAYPKAQLIGPEGLPEKRAANKENAGVDFAYVVTKDNKRSFKLPSDLAADFEFEYVHSHVNKELVFMHKATKTLIEADLIFNLPATEQYSKTGEPANTGALTKVFDSIQNTRAPATGQKRFVWYAAGGKDRAGFGESVAIIDKWDFERIIPCHGDVIEGNGKQVFRMIMEWYLTKKN